MKYPLCTLTSVLNVRRVCQHLSCHYVRDAALIAHVSAASIIHTLGCAPCGFTTCAMRIAAAQEPYGIPGS